jgi:hypothetical protein
MKFSHAIVLLALLSSSLFGAGKKFSVVEAAPTSDSNATSTSDHEEQAGVPTDTKIDDSSPPPSVPDGGSSYLGAAL